jgi:hypothetical protein
MSFFGETFIVGNTLENDVNANGYGVNNASNISFLPSGNLTSDGLQLLYNGQPIGGGSGSGGTVTSVSAAGNLSITGNATINPTVNITNTPTFSNVTVGNKSVLNQITSNNGSVTITTTGNSVDLSVPPPGSGTVTSVGSGSNVSITGTATDPVVNVVSDPSFASLALTANGGNCSLFTDASNLLKVNNANIVQTITSTDNSVTIVASDANVDLSVPPAPVQDIVGGVDISVVSNSGTYTINYTGGGGGGGVQSVSAGPSGNIVVAGTATDPTVDTSATPTFETIGVKNVNTLSATLLQQDSGAVAISAVNLGAPAPLAGLYLQVRNAVVPGSGEQVSMSLDSGNQLTLLTYNDQLGTQSAILELRNCISGSGISIANPSPGVLEWSATGLQSITSADANITVNNTSPQDPVIQLSQTPDVLSLTLNNPNSNPTSGTLTINATHQLCLDGVVIGPGGAANLPITIGNTSGPKVQTDIIVAYNPDVPATIQKLIWTDDDSRGFLFDGNVNISGGLGCSNFIFAPDTSVPNLSVPYLYLDNQGVVQLDNTLNPFPQSVTTLNIGGNLSAQGNVSADGQIATTGDLFAKQLFLNTSQSIGGITTSGPSLIVPTAMGFLNDLILYTPASGGVSNLFTTGVLTQNYTGLTTTPDPSLGETVFSASYYPGYTTGHQFQTKVLISGPYAHTDLATLYTSLNGNLSQTPTLNFGVAGTVDLTQITTGIITGTLLQFAVLLTSQNITFKLDNLSPTPTTVEVLRGETPHFVYSAGTTSWTYLGN